MSGPHVEAQVLALVERRLAPDERARVEAHLAGCARCRAAATELFETVDSLEALPAALRALPVRAAQQWPAVWARVRGARPAQRAWPQVSVYLSLVTTFLVVVSMIPNGGLTAAASVTAGVAAGPQLTPPATVVQREAGLLDSTGTAGLAVAEAAPTLSGTEAVQPIPIPTPVPGP